MIWAFVCKFIDDENVEMVIDSITKEFNNAIIKDSKLKMDVAIIIEAMILKRISTTVKKDKFLRRLNMRQYATVLNCHDVRLFFSSKY